MKRQLLLLLGMPAAMGGVMPLHASTAENDSIRQKALDEVLVIGNMRQKALLHNPIRTQSSLTSSISKVDAVELDRQGAVTLMDAMKYTPGAWIESRGRKLEQVFSVRGQRYPYPSFALNGIWQKDFEHISYYMNTANIAEVSITRSSAALLNSLTALAGVVNIKTVQPTARQARAFLKYGSLNSYRTGLSYADANDRISYTFAVNGNGTKGEKDMNGKENMLNAMASFDWRLSDKWSWGVNAYLMYGERQLYLAKKPASDVFINKKEKYDPYKAMLLASKLKYMANERFSSELQLNFARQEPLFFSTNLKTGKSVEYHEISNEFTANWINALALSRDNTLRFGMLYNYWLAPNGKCFYYGKKEKVHTLSAVVTDQHTWGNLLIDGGVRVTGQYFANWGGFSLEGAPGIFNKVESIVDEWQSPEWQATFGLTYAFSEHSQLNFSYAGGVVSPRKGGLTEDRKRPHNETRMNVDLGYTLKSASAGSLAVTAFLVNRANGITYSSKTMENEDGVIMELYKNVDLRNYGVEVDYRSPVFFRSLSFFTNATLMLGQRNEQDKWKKDEELPCFIANLGTNFQRGRWDVNAYLNYVGPYENDRFMAKDYVSKFGKAPLGDFLTVDLTAGYRLGKSKNLRLFVEGHNLFDNKYSTAAGYTDKGRLLFGGFDIRF